MGRGNQQADAGGLGAAGAGAPRPFAPRGRRRLILEWIAALDRSEQPYAPVEVAREAQLMREHGPVPDGLDPLLDLPADVAWREPGEQLVCLVRAYGAEASWGYGLALLAAGTASSDGERRLAQQARRRLQGTMGRLGLDSEEEALEIMLRAYRAREAHLHWACLRLGWPSDWVLETIRATALRRAEQAGPLPAGTSELPSPDPDHDAELDELYGPPPPGVNPLSDLPEGIEGWEPAEQLEALEEAYREVVRGLLAQEEMLEGEVDGPFASELLERLHEEAERAGEEDETAALHRWQRLRSAEEAQLHWAAQALGIPTSALVRYLKERVRSSA